MLRVTRLTDRTGRYYLADLASELDATSIEAGTPPPDAPGPRARWLGAAALGLGLSGRVHGDALAAVLSGRHPSGTHRLRLRETSVSAYDLTFAAPKSVSVLFALGDTGRATAVRAAHEAAVGAALAYVESHAAAVRHTTTHERGTSAVNGVVAASFTHGVSRSHDPHLHSHVLVANVSRGGDGRWRALDGRGLYAHASAAGALYDAVLRFHVATRLGLEWAPRGQRGWELSAVDPALLGALSGRRAEILTRLGMHPTRRPPSPRARAVAWAVTREPKTTPPPAATLRARWAAVARDVGWSAGPALGGTTRDVRSGRPEADEYRFAAAIAGTGHHGVARRDALGAWAGALRSGATAEEIGRCVDVLADWGGGTGVAEQVRPPSTVVPPGHVQRALGPRPASSEDLVVWQSAASSIARYRARWEVRDTTRALGAETRGDLSAFPVPRLVDHLTTKRAIDEALQRLGRTRMRERDQGPDVARGLERASR